MNTLAFLQNQWFKDPERMKKIYNDHWEGGANGKRNDFIRTFLFFGCLTGRRIIIAFGEQEALNNIIWEEVSPHIGGKASSAFPPDLKHIAAAIKQHRPHVILTFGKIALKGVTSLFKSERQYEHHIHGPHPAARHATVTQELKVMAKQWRDYRDELERQKAALRNVSGL